MDGLIFHWKRSIPLIVILLGGCNSAVEFAAIPEPPKPVYVEPPPVLYESVSQVFHQKDISDKVDILFVDDNSASMSLEQEEMGRKFPSFLKYLEGLDWQIAITTTDVSPTPPHGLQGSFLPFSNGLKILSPQVEHPEILFAETIARPESRACGGALQPPCPSGNEQPLRAAIMAMQKVNGENFSFFRQDADVAVVVLSDEDEMSSGPPQATKPADVLAAFQALWPNGKKFSAYGIIVEPGDLPCAEFQTQSTGNGITYGTHVSALSTMTDGVTGSICAPDYSPILEAISSRLSELIHAVILERDPLPESVKVTFDPHQDIAWKLKGRKVEFSRRPARATEIHVEYQAVVLEQPNRPPNVGD